MLQRPLQQPIGQSLEIFPAHLAVAQMDLGGEQMILTGLGPSAVGGEHVGFHGQLLGEKRHGRGWGTGRSSGTKPIKRSVHSCRA
jgi:hypothetical protein